MAPRTADNFLFAVFCVDYSSAFSEFCLSCSSVFLISIIQAKPNSSLLLSAFLGLFLFIWFSDLVHNSFV